MNLQKLFEIQRELDERIVEKHGLRGEDLLPKKILSLQVELGELANEWRGFKFWSKDQEPRTKKIIHYTCSWCGGTGEDPETFDMYCKECEGEGEKAVQHTGNPLLEEYVDCLHFILSIGLEVGFADAEPWQMQSIDDLTDQFIKMIYISQQIYISTILHDIEKWQYEHLFSEFLRLGEKLGFKWDEVEQSYLEKNLINHERQESGY